jgi:uncharacterized protein YjbJ (UPF0337 family)
MNRDILKGKWQELQGKVKSRWGELTDDDLTQIRGERDELIGRLRQRYGIARDAAAREVDEFLASP